MFHDNVLDGSFQLAPCAFLSRPHDAVLLIICIQQVSDGEAGGLEYGAFTTHSLTQALPCLPDGSPTGGGEGGGGEGAGGTP